ncbi:hypothetical protein DXG01_011801 [Tephrocybe rancida]|nr:hypothetical protein DXG01_011801 [Tephrocybe rancida]
MVTLAIGIRSGSASSLSSFRASSTMSKPSILIIGATGNVGSALVKLFDQAGKTEDILLTYLGHPPDKKYKSIEFDWGTPSTFDAPFDTTKYAITTVFILFPMGFFDTLKVSEPFLERANKAGWKRFVLLSGTLRDKGTKPIGDVHEYIVDTIKKEYSILRPTGHFTLFSDQPFRDNIRDYNHLRSAIKDGRIPLVHVDDVADVAYHALTDAQSPNKEQPIVGPELFSLDDVAALLSRSDIIDREISHIRLTSQQSFNMLKNAYRNNPEAEKLADYWSKADARDAMGAQEAFFFKEGTIIGTRRLKAYLEDHAKAGAWTPAK